ncbi:MAG: glycosyltransferase family 2 protein [Bryobacteraceae bacterium]
MRLGICIGTFRRRELLRQLLVGVSELTFQKMPAPDISVIVVDNESSRTAEEICGSVKLPWPIKYVVESQRGIAHVRNRAMLEAGNVDFIAFIDDDEVPTPLWLDELLWTQAEFAADVVSGPVLPAFTPDVPKWIRTGGLFRRPIFPVGYLMERCSTNNVLIRNEVFSRIPSFDQKFELTGADDTHFFLRVRQAGYRIIWSREAVVNEVISTQRANVGWILRRAYREGNGWVLCELSLDKRISTRTRRFLKAFARIFQGIACCLVSLFVGRAAIVRALSRVFLGVGMLVGLVGHKYQAYRTAGTDIVYPPPKGIAGQP